MEAATRPGININPETIETAAPLASNIMQGTKDAMGFVPNMYKSMGNNPALLDAYTHSYNSFRANSGFNSVEQEVVFLSVAYENNCEYCMAAHSFVGDMMTKVPTEVTNAIRDDKQIPDVKLAALSKLTRSLTATRGNISQEEKTSRQESLKIFNKEGFPNKKLEEWKFTDLNKIINDNFEKIIINSELAHNTKLKKIDDFEHNSIILINGHLNSKNFKFENEKNIKVSNFKEELITKKKKKNSLGHLNDALFEGGYFLEVNADYQFTKPLIIYGPVGIKKVITL
jgi:AhpD family alkylhydroperoxidase